VHGADHRGPRVAGFPEIERPLKIVIPPRILFGGSDAESVPRPIVPSGPNGIWSSRHRVPADAGVAATRKVPATRMENTRPRPHASLMIAPLETPCDEFPVEGYPTRRARECSFIVRGMYAARPFG
jgi:hypothetical protein